MSVTIPASPDADKTAEIRLDLGLQLAEITQSVKSHQLALTRVFSIPRHPRVDSTCRSGPVTASQGRQHHFEVQTCFELSQPIESRISQTASFSVTVRITPLLIFFHCFWMTYMVALSLKANCKAVCLNTHHITIFMKWTDEVNPGRNHYSWLVPLTKIKQVTNEAE